eukprot:3941727-Rhodomonas_salina.4
MRITCGRRLVPRYQPTEDQRLPRAGGWVAPIVLCVCYAMSGTAIGYAVTPSVLRISYAMSSADAGYIYICYATSRNEPGYAATRCFLPDKRGW